MIKPETFVVEITNRCNLNCIHCSVGNKDHKDILLNDLMVIAEKIANLGATNIILTGGEPFLYQDIECALQFISQLSLNIIFTTNGTGIDNEVLKILKKYQVRDIQVSIDGLKEEHEKIRGKNTFDITIKNISLLIGHGFNLNTMTVINKYNSGILDDLVDFLADIGVKRIAFERCTPVGNAITNIISLDKTEYHECIKKLINKSADSQIILNDPIAIFFNDALKEKAKIKQLPFSGCLGGIINWAIDVDGYLKICTRTPVTIGKFIDIDWQSLLENSLIKNLVLRNLTGKCGRCIYKSGCGGCRVHSTSFDLQIEDDFCLFDGVTNESN